MGIFARLAALIKSNINDLISKAEDPEKMLNQVVLDMSNQLIEAKKQVAVSIADEKRLAKQAEQEEAKAAEWHRRAMLAVRAGDDALAKEALQRKQEHQQLADGFKDQWQKQKAAVDQIKTALRVLNNKIEDAKRKKALIIARARRAQAQKQIQETIGGLTANSAFEVFDRMEQRVNQAEAEAEAQSELAEEYTGDVAAHKFKQLEANMGADDELMALKRQMGVLPPEAPPPAEEVAAAPPVRVAEQKEPEPELSKQEQDELEKALAELEAQEQAQQARMKR
ncbi:MAG: PspA/IM30 family protein [Myxococcales bacterium]|nr:PspA/IM30 family protein [Myxococcales bacterium]